MKIEGNKYRISIIEYIPKKMDEIFIACHGFGGDKESSAIELLAKTVNKMNIGVVSFDFPAHGESEVDGDFLTIENCINDLEFIEKYVKEKFNINKINIFSTSFGAYITLLKIIKNDADYNKIILRAPAIKMNEIFKNYLLQEDLSKFYERGYSIMGFERKMKVYTEYLKELEDNEIIDLYNDKKDILIIQGDEDNVAPIKDTYEFVEKNKNIILKVLPRADHRMKKEGEMIQVMEWVKEYLKEKE